ncbi:MAG: hypothetical protein WC076_08000 [Terrimicrobiaceae bacterium]|nr:hypothetical protein [Terrimicrobiaceae bacterium]
MKTDENNPADWLRSAQEHDYPELRQSLAAMIALIETAVQNGRKSPHVDDTAS